MTDIAGLLTTAQRYCNDGVMPDVNESAYKLVADLASAVRVLEEQRQAALKLHEKREYTDYWTHEPTGKFYCFRCIRNEHNDSEWPCATVRALGGGDIDD